MIKHILKKFFIKICRLLDFEIIDQNQFTSPTLNHPLNENLSKINRKSIELPLGEVKLTRKVKELLIIAQDTTSYGWDLKPKQYLNNLVEELDRLDFEWIRIHYAHPAHLSRKIIQSIADANNVCSYLDMPIQHASDPILKSMRRGLNADGIKKRIQLLRDAVQDIKIGTTLIVGYPGETEKDFEKILLSMIFE